jgi:multidrug efflux pump subunit AcrA (membrane-fusion protein)
MKMGHGLLITAVLLYTLTACTAQSTSSTPPIPALVQPSASGVNTAFADTGPVFNAERFEGITRVLSEPLSFGAIGEGFGAFYVLTGDSVTQGQLLARLEGEGLEGEITRLTAEIESLRRESISLNTPQGIWANERRALSLRHMEEDLLLLETRLEACALYAPFGGTVTFVADKQPGQWVSPWEPVIYIAPNQEPLVEYGGGTEIPRAVRVTGQIDGVTYELQPVPHSVPPRFTVPGKNLRLGAGVVITAYTHWVESALRIPINALFTAPSGETFAYRMENGAQVYAPLTVGLRTAVYAEVIGGLREGDEVFVRP